MPSLLLGTPSNIQAFMGTARGTHHKGALDLLVAAACLLPFPLDLPTVRGTSTRHM